MKNSEKGTTKQKGKNTDLVESQFSKDQRADAKKALDASEKQSKAKKSEK